MLSDAELEALVNRAIATFNRVRAPQVSAKLVSFLPDTVTVEFTGVLCFECSTQNVTDAFLAHFKALSNEVELKQGKTKQTNPHTIQTTYAIKPNKKQ